MRKSLSLILAMQLMLSLSFGQTLKKEIPSTFSLSLANIIENYPNNYRLIQGDLLQPDEDRDIFKSTIELPGASQCVIYRFHSTEDTTASWQGVLYEGEDFKEATKVYKNCFRYLKQTKFKVGISHYTLNGAMENPSEELRFTTSTLRPDTYSVLYNNFMAEIEIVNSITGWTVRLNLHSRKNDDMRY
jgi:hypothetical protein